MPEKFHEVGDVWWLFCLSAPKTQSRGLFGLFGNTVDSGTPNVQTGFGDATKKIMLLKEEVENALGSQNRIAQRFSDVADSIKEMVADGEQNSG